MYEQHVISIFFVYKDELNGVFFLSKRERGRKFFVANSFKNMLLIVFEWKSKAFSHFKSMPCVMKLPTTSLGYERLRGSHIPLGRLSKSIQQVVEVDSIF